MFKTKTWLITCVVLLALVVIGTRFFKLAAVPAGMTWDEAAIGYNGWSVWTVRRDEWLEFLPITFKSFGDYKSPLAIYTAGASTVLFGRNLWAVRLPFALASIASIITFGALVFESLRTTKLSFRDKLTWAGGASLLMTLNPWHHFFSRVGFESGIALFFLLFCIYSFIRWVHTKQIWWLPLSAASAVLNLYTYHSGKIVVPLIGLFLLWNYREIVIGKIQKQILLVLVVLIATFAGFYPLAKASLVGSASERLNQVSFITKDSLSWREKGEIFIEKYLAHVDPAFLVGGATNNYRHGDGSWGVLLPTTFVFWLYFIGYYLFNNIQKTKNKIDFFDHLSIAMVIFGLIPAGISAGAVPHANRALLALPGFLLGSLLGFRYFLTWLAHSKWNKNIMGSHGELHTVLKSTVGIIVLAHILFAISMLRDYYVEFPAKSSEAFVEGYQAMITELNAYESGERDFVPDQYVVTSSYGQPYIFVLFQNSMSPIAFHNGALVKFMFKEIDLGDLNRENTVVVSGAEPDLRHHNPTTEITTSVGEPVFYIFERP